MAISLFFYIIVIFDFDSKPEVKVEIVSGFESNTPIVIIIIIIIIIIVAVVIVILSDITFRYSFLVRWVYSRYFTF